MLELDILDEMFDAPSAGSPFDVKNPYISWRRNGADGGFVVVTDNSLKEKEANHRCDKVAWLLESPNPKNSPFYEMRKKWKFRDFKRVFTHDKRLLKCGDKFTLTLVGGSWIPKPDWKIYPKDKNMSIVASSKNDLPGHKLRHEVIKHFGDHIDDVYGRPHRFVENKVDALKHHRYSIVIENQRMDYYFTEKIIDCFATGTIPIYWGCPGIGRFFDLDGIIQFEHPDELESLLPQLSAEDYAKRQNAVRHNFNKAENYRFPEKALAENIMSDPALKQLVGC